jgi:hypothetical protein
MSNDNPLGVPAHRHRNPDGTEGGWVADTATVAAKAHIGRYARVLGGTIWGGTIEGGTIRGGTIWGGTIRGGIIRGGTIWGGTIWGGTIWGGTIEGGTIYGGSIRGGTIYGGTIEGGTIYGGTIEGGTIWGGTIVVHSRHITTAGPMGSEGSIVTLAHTADGHQIHAGCWTGTLDEMVANVTSGDRWPDVPERAVWRAEFLALAELFRLRIAEWDTERAEVAS